MLLQSQVNVITKASGVPRRNCRNLPPCSPTPRTTRARRQKCCPGNTCGSSSSSSLLFFLSMLLWRLYLWLRLWLLRDTVPAAFCHMTKFFCVGMVPPSRPRSTSPISASQHLGSLLALVIQVSLNQSQNLRGCVPWPKQGLPFQPW